MIFRTFFRFIPNKNNPQKHKNLKCKFFMFFLSFQNHYKLLRIYGIFNVENDVVDNHDLHVLFYLLFLVLKIPFFFLKIHKFFCEKFGRNFVDALCIFHLFFNFLFHFLGYNYFQYFYGFLIFFFFQFFCVIFFSIFCSLFFTFNTIFSEFSPFLNYIFIFSFS